MFTHETLMSISPATISSRGVNAKDHRSQLYKYIKINDCAMKFDGAQVSTSAMLLGMLIIF
jgi:hypothetical protein